MEVNIKRGKSVAKMKAKKLLSQCNVDLENVNIKKGDLGINVTDIAEKLGIKVVIHSFSDDISGLFFKKNNQLFLGVNKNHHERRRRFTISHELGHYLLHSDAIFHYDVQKLDLEQIYFRAENISSFEEVEANHFAAELLMPEQIINKCVENNLTSISELAKRFNVSEDAMRYRLTNLGYL